MRGKDTVSVPDSTASATPQSNPQANSEPAGVQSSQKEYAVRRLDMELGAGDFEIRVGDDFTVSTSSGSLRGITTSMDGDTWRVESTSSAWRGQGVVTITVPKDFTAQKLDIELGAGQLTVDGLTAENADIEVGAGRAEFANCKLNNASLDCAMGELVYRGALTGIGEISCGMGNTELHLSGEDDFGYSVECGVGTVDVFGYRYSGLGAEAVQNAGASVFYAIDCGMGNVSLMRG